MGTCSQDADESFELYCADGLAPPVKLSGTLIAAGDVQTDALFSPDGAWVYYRADAVVDGRIELFRVPSDGSASPMALSGPIVSGGAVQGTFRITPDGSLVLFRADREVQFREDLYSVPSDGSAPPLRLNSNVSAFSAVHSFVLDPAGARAVFHYTVQSLNERLYSVPVDGSGSQILLTPGNGHPFARVLELQEGAITADGTRVVYRANIDNLSNDELYSVVLDGSASPVKLNPPLGGYGDVLSFRVSPNGERVAFRAEWGTVGYPEEGMMCDVPVDRRREPVKLNPSNTIPDPDPSGDYHFGPGSASLVYRLDAVQSVSYDLYAAPLVKGPRRRTPTPP